MSEHKTKISRLCLAGFILSVLPLVLLGAVIGFFFLMGSDDFSDFFSDLYIVISILPVVSFLLSLIGLGLSIAGVVTAVKEGRKGKGLGIAGIAFPVLYGAAVIVLIGWLGVTVVKGINDSARDRETSDIYNMGSVYDPQNTEYDVSRYRIFDGYELNSADNPSSESELKAYAESRLETISKENDVYVKGTRQKATFLIIRRDRFDDWGKIEPIGGVDRWSKEYLTIQYQYQWEFSAFRTCYLDMYKDPSDKFIIITNCSDYKVITEFFG